MFFRLPSWTLFSFHYSLYTQGFCINDDFCLKPKIHSLPYPLQTLFVSVFLFLFHIFPSVSLIPFLSLFHCHPILTDFNTHLTLCFRFSENYPGRSPTSQSRFYNLFTPYAFLVYLVICAIVSWPHASLDTKIHVLNPHLLPLVSISFLLYSRILINILE